MNVSAILIHTPKRLARILGGTLEAVQTRSGKTMVNLRRMCDSVGADFDSEYAKLVSPDCGWAKVLEMTVRVVNQSRELTMIDLKAVPMWLASIEPETVKPSARKRLEQFQRETTAVLGAWTDGLPEGNLVHVLMTAARQRAALGAALEVMTPKNDAKPRQHELEDSIIPDKWRLSRTTELMMTLIRHCGETDATEVRSQVLAALREALEGGGRLKEDLVSGEELVDLPGVFRIALCSAGPPTDYEAETATAIVQRTLDRLLASE